MGIVLGVYACCLFGCSLVSSQITIAVQKSTRRSNKLKRANIETVTGSIFWVDSNAVLWSNYEHEEGGLAHFSNDPPLDGYNVTMVATFEEQNKAGDFLKVDRDLSIVRGDLRNLPGVVSGMILSHRNCQIVTRWNGWDVATYNQVRFSCGAGHDLSIRRRMPSPILARRRNEILLPITAVEELSQDSSDKPTRTVKLHVHRLEHDMREAGNVPATAVFSVSPLGDDPRSWVEYGVPLPAKTLRTLFGEAFETHAVYLSDGERLRAVPKVKEYFIKLGRRRCPKLKPVPFLFQRVETRMDAADCDPASLQFRRIKPAQTVLFAMARNLGVWRYYATCPSFDFFPYAFIWADSIAHQSRSFGGRPPSPTPGRDAASPGSSPRSGRSESSSGSPPGSSGRSQSPQLFRRPRPPPPEREPPPLPSQELSPRSVSATSSAPMAGGRSGRLDQVELSKEKPNQLQAEVDVHRGAKPKYRESHL